MVAYSRPEEDREGDAHQGKGSYQASSQRHRPFVEDASDPGSARPQEPPGRSDSSGFARAARTDQARASLDRSDADRGIKSGNQSNGQDTRRQSVAARTNRPAQSGSGSGIASESQETRTRSGLGHR